MTKNKYCMESIEFECDHAGIEEFWCTREYGNHDVHEYVGTRVFTRFGNAIKINYTIQWTITEMEIE